MVSHWNDGTQYTAEELAEEVAWATIEQKKWIPTPLLLMWMTKFVKETIDCQGCIARHSGEHLEN